ncbi:MAG: sigma-70 family RNA polymerase sigma factor [Herpetosiphon sp.]
MDKPWDIDITVYDDEAALLEGLRRGDRIACTCMLKRFAPRLYRLALQLTGEADEAEDILQEAFIQACAHLADFEGRSGLGSWLHRIVLNTGLMRLRRSKKAPIDLASVGDEHAGKVPEALLDRTTEPGLAVLSDELNMMVGQAVLELPPALRAAFVLRDLEGVSTKDAAAALGINEPALKVRLHRARLALRGALAAYVAVAAGDEE